MSCTCAGGVSFSLTLISRAHQRRISTYKDYPILPTSPIYLSSNAWYFQHGDYPPLSPSFPHVSLPQLKLSTLYACHSAYFTVTIEMTQHRAYLCTFLSVFLCMFASQHVSKCQCWFCFHAGEFGVVYRAYLSGWEDPTSQVVAVKTLRGT